MEVPEEEVFLFVNPNSGGRIGEVFLEVPQPFTWQLNTDTFPEGSQATLRIFSLFEGEPGNKPGFHELTKTVAQKVRRTTSRGFEPVRVVAGGGDGTLMWVVSEAVKHGIDPLRQICIGIVPLGTGNDLARALGWGGANPRRADVLRSNCLWVGEMLDTWCSAQLRNHDVWNVTLQVDQQSGQIQQKEKVLEDRGTARKALETPMLLYLGIAKDAEVMYQVERRRTTSQFRNKLVFAWQGLKVMLHFLCCCAGQRVRRVVRGLYAGAGVATQTVFEVGKLAVQNAAPRLRTYPEMLLFLNIKSHAAGWNKSLWKYSYRLAVTSTQDPELLTRKQDPGDGNLEVLTLQRLIRMFLPTKKLLAGRRVYHGPGPLHLQFKRSNNHDVVTFVQMDGESYKLVNPTNLFIEHRMKIRVMYNTASPSSLRLCMACCYPDDGAFQRAPSESSDSDEDGRLLRAETDSIEDDATSDGSNSDTGYEVKSGRTGRRLPVPP